MDYWKIVEIFEYNGILNIEKYWKIVENIGILNIEKYWKIVEILENISFLCYNISIKDVS